MARKTSDILNIDGETWITVEAAAKILRTTTAKVQTLIANDILDSQNHPRRIRIIVPTRQVMAYRDSPENPNRGKGLPPSPASERPAALAKMIDGPPKLGSGAGAVSWPTLPTER
jgi:hypothetical protein